jgi:hypothetical protein
MEKQMRDILKVVTVLLIGFGLTAQSGSAQEEARTRIYEGDQHLSAFLANKATNAEPATLSPNAAAPGLSYISTYNTCGQATSTSTLICENDEPLSITTNSYPTTMYKIYEVVRIHGYGTTPIARLGGSTGSLVPSTDLVETDYLCGSNYTICTTGQTITGYQYWFDLTSMLNAGYPRLFYTESTGINNPGTTLSATLTIKQ